MTRDTGAVPGDWTDPGISEPNDDGTVTWRPTPGRDTGAVGEREGLRAALRRASDLIRKSGRPSTPAYRDGWLDALEEVANDPALATPPSEPLDVERPDYKRVTEALAVAWLRSNDAQGLALPPDVATHLWDALNRAGGAVGEREGLRVALERLAVHSPRCATCDHYEGEHHEPRPWDAWSSGLRCYHSNGGNVADCACREYARLSGESEIPPNEESDGTAFSGESE